MRWSPLITCIPQILTPRLLEVVFWHFFMNRSFLSGETSSPCWRVPIFRSRMLGWQYWAATFSNKMNSERAIKDSFLHSLYINKKLGYHYLKGVGGGGGSGPPWKIQIYLFTYNTCKFTKNRSRSPFRKKFWICAWEYKLISCQANSSVCTKNF